MSKHQREQAKNQSKYQGVVSRNNPKPTSNYQLANNNYFLGSYCQQLFKSNNQNQRSKLIWLALFLGVFGCWSQP
ncbi:MAG TPA: hypothetical protein VIQ31_31220, partial [Phormidium sp.]